MRSSIVFSITAEDHAVVDAALQPGPGKRVLCICSAGDTPLNLLARDVAGVLVVDSNPAQIYLAQLKAVGAAHLDIAQYRTLLGVAGANRLALEAYRLIRAHLPSEARQYWDQQERSLERGIIWQGSVQALFRAMRAILRIVIGSDGMRALRSIASPADAQRFSAAYLHSARAAFALRVIFSRPFFRLYYPKHGFRHLQKGQSPRDFAIQRIESALQRVPIAGNPYLHAFLFDAYPSLDHVPPYLTPHGHQEVKARTNRLEWHHSDLLAVLSTLQPGSVDAFDLCNVADWMSASDFAAVMSRVVVAAKPGARVLVFSRTKPVHVPEVIAAQCRRDQELSEALGQVERTGYYASTNVFTIS